MLLSSITAVLVGVLANSQLASAVPTPDEAPAFTFDELPAFTLHTRSASSKGAWGVHCFGTKKGHLNHKGTDAAVVDLKKYTGKGRTIKTDKHNGWKSFIQKGAKAYICTDHHHDSHTFTAAQVGAALGAMDSQCEAYEASYALWFEYLGGTKYRSTSKIVGKDFANSKICQNSQGGAIVKGPKQ